MSNLGDVFLASANVYPDRPALWVDETLFTYAQLLEVSLPVAGEINACTEDRSAPVAVLAQRSLSAYAGVLGTALAGRTFVPLNPRFPLERNLAIVNAAGASAIVADSQTEAVAKAIADAAGLRPRLIIPDALNRCLTTPSADSPDRSANWGKDPAAVASQHATAYIMFTSGTTGAPKGVQVTNSNVLRYLASMREILALSPEDRCTQLFDFSFDLSIHDLFVTWAAGASLYVLPRDASLQAVEFVRTHALTSWFSVPAAASVSARLRQLRAGAMPSLRISLFCGEALPIATAKLWAEAAPNSSLLNLYGPTEATIAITSYKYSAHVDLSACRSMPIGTAFADQETLVADPQENEVPDGQPGELWLGGSQVSLGYLNNATANREKFLDRSMPGRVSMRWYRTGDQCVVDERLGLLFLGRTDDQLKIQGHRVELMEVETALRRVCGNDVAAAVPWPVDETGAVQGLVAFVCAPAPPAQEIAAALAKLLPPYMIPRRVEFLDSMPLSTSGKIDRQKLRSFCETLDKRPARV